MHQIYLSRSIWELKSISNLMNNNLINKHRYYNNQWFAKWAKLYNYEKYLLFPLRRKAARFLDFDSPKKILDVATGTGTQAYELAKLGHEVTGIDLSKEMLDQAKKKCAPNLKLTFQQADATNLPFKNDYFDASSISFGLHDMPYEVDLLALKEMKRVTKNKGKILIVDNMEPKKHFIAKFSHRIVSLYETINYRPFIEKGLETVLSEAGLKIDKSTNFLGIFQINLATNDK